MHVFAQSAREQFIEALSEHLGQSRDYTAASVERALAYGFRDRGHIATWAEIELRYGVGFENRTEFAPVATVLHLDIDAATKLHKIRRRLNPPAETE